MSKWELKYYLGREIKTEEDVMWACEKVKKVYKEGSAGLEDMMVLSYLKELNKEHIDQGCFGIIESRFDILDIRDD